jgi:hypothetical protein
LRQAANFVSRGDRHDSVKRATLNRRGPSEYDLAIAVRMDNSAEFIASFLRRSPREVRDKIAELERSGDLRRLIERIAAFIAIDEDDLF